MKVKVVLKVKVGKRVTALCKYRLDYTRVKAKIDEHLANKGKDFQLFRKSG